jgi:hypothetical protein
MHKSRLDVELSRENVLSILSISIAQRYDPRRIRFDFDSEVPNMNECDPEIFLACLCVVRKKNKRRRVCSEYIFTNISSHACVIRSLTKDLSIYALQRLKLQRMKHPLTCAYLSIIDEYMADN